MPLNSDQVTDLMEKQGYRAVIQVYLDDYTTKALFMPEALKQKYQIELSDEDVVAAKYASDHRQELSQEIGRSLAVSTDVLDLGKDYESAKDLLQDLKTDALKPVFFNLLKQWLPTFKQVADEKAAALDAQL